MTMTKVNLTSVLQKYKSGWVAVSSDYRQVVAHADSFMVLQKKIQNKKNVVVIQALANYYNYVS